MAEHDPLAATPAAAPQDAGSVPSTSVAPTAPVAPAATIPEAAPLAAAPAPEPAPAPAPAAEPAKAAETTIDKPSLLESFGKDDGKTPKPPEAPELSAAPKPTDSPKPGDPAGALAQPDPAAPFEYKYSLPETLKMDDGLKAEVHGAFDAFRTNPAEGVQKLIDLHAKTMQSYAEQLGQDQHRVFNEMRADWNKEILADPEIGGSGHETALRAIARVRDLLAGPEMAPRKHADGSPRLSELEEFLRVTGAGDHPVFHRMLHRAARFIDEPQPHDIPLNIKPTSTNGRAPGSFKDAMYDNPRSNPNGRA